jgi:hypothetical protein
MTNGQVKCAICRIDIVGPEDPQPNSYFSCPACGNGDTYENMLQEIADQLANKTATRIYEMFTGLHGHSGRMKISSTHSPNQKRYRFFVDVEL